MASDLAAWTSTVMIRVNTSKRGTVDPINRMRRVRRGSCTSFAVVFVIEGESDGVDELLAMDIF